MEIEERHRERQNRRDGARRATREQLRLLLERMENLTEEELEEVLRLADTNEEFGRLRQEILAENRRRILGRSVRQRNREQGLRARSFEDARRNHRRQRQRRRSLLNLRETRRSSSVC